MGDRCNRKRKEIQEGVKSFFFNLKKPGINQASSTIEFRIKRKFLRFFPSSLG